MKRIALIGALRHEIIDVARKLIVTRSVILPGLRLIEGVFVGKEVLLAETGIGKERASNAAVTILERYPLSAVISFGFGGALKRDQRIGDLVLCREFHSLSETQNQQIHRSNDVLLQVAGHIMENRRGNRSSGPIVTIDWIVTHPSERTKLRERFSAHVVDMESYWIADAATHREIPFLGVRAISDTFDCPPPPFDHFFNQEGRWLPSKTFRYFLHNPGDHMNFPRLLVSSRQARKSLTEFLQEFIPAIPQESTVGHFTE